MQLENYIFHFTQANQFSARSASLPRPLRGHELFVLGAVKDLPIPTYGALKRHADRIGYPLNEAALFRSIDFLLRQGLIEKDGRLYSVTFAARDYLSSLEAHLLG